MSKFKNIDEAKAKSKAVLQYDLQGNFIKEYPSYVKAQHSTGIITIYKACIGEYKTAGGFIWKFKNGKCPKHVKPYKRPGVAVLQCSKDGKLIKEWSSAKEAAEELYISPTAITACCKKYKNIVTAGGYKWKYKK